MAISLICIGRNMRRERKRAGLTQNELAQKLDISETHYSNLERAKRGLNIEFLIEFCAALDIPLERLLIGAVTGVRIHDKRRRRIDRTNRRDHSYLRPNRKTMLT